MISGAVAVRRGETLRLAGACVGLLALAAGLGSAANLLRPAATRLPWVGDWAHHVETKAFQAGIPVTFLAGARERTADPATVVFDARVPEQYEAGHLPGARNVPLADLGSRLRDLPVDREIVAYCRGPYCVLSFEAVHLLRRHGRSARRLKDGLPEWRAAGHPVDVC